MVESYNYNTYCILITKFLFISIKKCKCVSFVVNYTTITLITMCLIYKCRHIIEIENHIIILKPLLLLD